MNINNMTKDQEVQEEALQNVLKKYNKIMHRRNKREWEQLDNEIHETTRVSIDNLTSDDL